MLVSSANSIELANLLMLKRRSFIYITEYSRNPRECHN